MPLLLLVPLAALVTGAGLYMAGSGAKNVVQAAAVAGAVYLVFEGVRR